MVREVCIRLCVTFDVKSNSHGMFYEAETPESRRAAVEDG